MSKKNKAKTTNSEPLQNQKLELEIRVFKRHWLKNPQYIAALAAIIFTLLSFVVSVRSGFWDMRKLVLENEKIVLQIEIVKFEKQKADILKENDSLRREFKSIGARYKDFSQKYNEEKKEIATELQAVQVLLKSNSNSEANQKLRMLFTKLGGISRRVFDDSFDDSFQ